MGVCASTLQTGRESSRPGVQFYTRLAMKRVNVWKKADAEPTESFTPSVAHQQKSCTGGEFERRWSIPARRPLRRSRKLRSSAFRVTVRTLAVMQRIPLIPKIQHDVIEEAAADCSSRNRVMRALG